MDERSDDEFDMDRELATEEEIANEQNTELALGNETENEANEQASMQVGSPGPAWSAASADSTTSTHSLKRLRTQRGYLSTPSHTKADEPACPRWLAGTGRTHCHQGSLQQPQHGRARGVGDARGRAVEVPAERF